MNRGDLVAEKRLSPEVTVFLDTLNHPLREESELLRRIIVHSNLDLDEGIKWNGPNYSIHGEDRVTLRVGSPKQLQVIFHRGAKKKEQPEERLLDEEYGVLQWKENDRAIASFYSLEDVQTNSEILQEIIVKWIEATT